MPRNPNSPIAAALRKAIARSGLTQYEIAKRAKVPQSQLTRIMRGSLPRLDTAERVCRVIGLRLIIVAKTQG